MVFEGPLTILDWGISHEIDERSSLERRLTSLQSLFTPSIILARATDKPTQLSRPTFHSTLHTLNAFAKSVLVTVLLIEESSIRGFFSKETRINKHDIALMVADRFPELSWRLPPKRKSWQSEPTRQSIFDAASLGIYYFAQQVDVRRTVASGVE